MGLIDALNAEDRIEVKFSTLYSLMNSSAEANSELKYIENALTAGVPNNYILSMIDGIPREAKKDGPIYGQEELDKHDS